MDQDTKRFALEGRAYLYQLFHTLLGAEPTPEILAAASDETIEGVLEAFSQVDVEFAQAAQTYLTTVRASDAQAARGEYTRLFIGPNHLPAGPWESLYVGANPTQLFTEDTLAVRKAYRAQGFLPKGYPSVADDHVALEMSFMQHLSVRMNEALTSDDTEAAERARAAMASFLADHLNKWLPLWSDKLSASVQGSPLYPKVAALACAFCKLDAQLLAELGE